MLTTCANHVHVCVQDDALARQQAHLAAIADLQHDAGQVQEHMLRDALARAEALQSELEHGEYDDVQRMRLAALMHEATRTDADRTTLPVRLIDEIHAARRKRRLRSARSRTEKLKALSAARAALAGQQRELEAQRRQLKQLRQRGTDILVELELGNAPPLDLVLRNADPGEPTDGVDEAGAAGALGTALARHSVGIEASVRSDDAGALSVGESAHGEASSGESDPDLDDMLRRVRVDLPAAEARVARMRQELQQWRQSEAADVQAQRARDERPEPSSHHALITAPQHPSARMVRALVVEMVASVLASCDGASVRAEATALAQQRRAWAAAHEQRTALDGRRAQLRAEREVWQDLVTEAVQEGVESVWHELAMFRAHSDRTVAESLAEAIRESTGASPHAASEVLARALSEMQRQRSIDDANFLGDSSSKPPTQCHTLRFRPYEEIEQVRRKRKARGLPLAGLQYEDSHGEPVRAGAAGTASAPALLDIRRRTALAPHPLRRGTHDAWEVGYWRSMTAHHVPLHVCKHDVVALAASPSGCSLAAATAMPSVDIVAMRGLAPCAVVRRVKLGSQAVQLQWSAAADALLCVDAGGSVHLWSLRVPPPSRPAWHHAGMFAGALLPPAPVPAHAASAPRGSLPSLHRVAHLASRSFRRVVPEAAVVGGAMRAHATSAAHATGMAVGVDEQGLQRLLHPVRVGFHASMTAVGGQPSVLVGTRCGLVVKWNHASLAGDAVLAPPAAPFEPVNPLEAPEAAQDRLQRFPNTPHREFFHAHRAPLVFVGCAAGTPSVVVTVDAAGLVCLWRYDAEAFSGFGWFEPTMCTQVQLAPFTFAPAAAREPAHAREQVFPPRGARAPPTPAADPGFLRRSAAHAAQLASRLRRLTLWHRAAADEDRYLCLWSPSDEQLRRRDSDRAVALHELMHLRDGTLLYHHVGWYDAVPATGSIVQAELTRTRHDLALLLRFDEPPPRGAMLVLLLLACETGAVCERRWEAPAPAPSSPPCMALSCAQATAGSDAAFVLLRDRMLVVSLATMRTVMEVELRAADVGARVMCALGPRLGVAIAAAAKPHTVTLYALQGGAENTVERLEPVGGAGGRLSRAGAQQWCRSQQFDADTQPVARAMRSIVLSCMQDACESAARRQLEAALGYCPQWSESVALRVAANASASRGEPPSPPPPSLPAISS